MCNFLSFLVTRQGEILWHESTDSHEDLVSYYRAHDSMLTGNFVRCEYCPAYRKDLADLSKYSLRVDDEETTPEWFQEIVESVEGKARAIVSRMILKDVGRDILLGGPWILAGETQIGTAANARIIALNDAASITCLRGSSVIESMRDHTYIQRIVDTANITGVFDDARIGSVNDMALVRGMFGNARIGTLFDMAQVESMYDNASIGLLKDMSRVGRMHDRARIEQDDTRAEDKTTAPQ